MNGSSLIDSTSLFSAPEGAPRGSAAASPPPVTDPFHAPDFGDEADLGFEETEPFPPETVPERDAHRPRYRRSR
ncbi:hypothetical protein ACH4KC_15145 [Streptomyces griseoaurantiacus]|uniref:hypothetical protein n=1 Tax=Streptomyces TaxID=1883 RepID=UPI0014327FBE|nr:MULTISPECIES: hypothetical protein [Streptomyces]MCF0085424.1 hypothetical protein [Streptomyces sp. MH192]MCF0097858.1 hypothetical protein [Streptomyces sp. MH191]NJP70505.1 hypothetical protein [Streptomyces sp. C1-2]WTI28883.1 hypothetical protein OHA67_22465 [Streptomyces jietaisiensis]